ncbi:MAG: Phosphoribosylglycinamide synthetase, domain, partial [Cyanobacteriota bacterium]
GLGDTFEAALASAYAAVDQIHFDHMYCRRDIGYRVKGLK